jgi:hypothetical protein
MRVIRFVRVLYRDGTQEVFVLPKDGQSIEHLPRPNVVRGWLRPRILPLRVYSDAQRERALCHLEPSPA